MKLPAIRLSRLWPFLVWCAVGVILFWPVRGYYVALPAPDSPPFFPAAYRLRYVEQFLAGNTALSPHHLFSLLLPPLVHHDLIYLVDTLLIAAGVPAKVVAERLGHSRASFTIDSYQHVLPGMQADAAATFATLITDGASTGSNASIREKTRKKSA